MRRKIFLYLISGLAALVVLIILTTIFIIEPWLENKIQTTLNKSASIYQVKIAKVTVSVFTFRIKLKTITISSGKGYNNRIALNGKIEYIKIKGISLTKAIFANDFYIREVTVSNSKITGILPFSSDSTQSIISSINIRFDKIIIANADFSIKNALSSQSYTVKDGNLTIYDLQVMKKDTLTTAFIQRFDLNVKMLQTVSSDSMYTVSVNGTEYAASSNTFKIINLTLHPNYENYDFSSRHKYQSDRIEANFDTIYLNDFSAENFLNSGSLISSSIEIKNMDLNVFRDRRKEFHHINKPMFQEILYNYMGKINVDSLILENGKIAYTEHAENANHPGRIHFNKINAKSYRITNDTAFKNEKTYLRLKSNALLMGKGKLTISLKAELFENQNTFSMSGTLSGMEAKELNPMLERNAFLYATSGNIDEMNFHFTANNNKAIGELTMLYDGLDIAIKSESTDDTTALKERIVSIIANIKIMNSNPLPGEKVRIGIIDFDRDPEKFIFNYCIKAILSGIKSGITKNPTGHKDQSTSKNN